MIEGEGKKNNLQHNSMSCFLCLSPLIMCFLHVAGGGETLRKRRAKGQKEKNINSLTASVIWEKMTLVLINKKTA